MNHSRRSAVRVRTLGAAVVLGATLALSGCGFGAQTLQTYTPAHGVNVDDGGVKVRNLLVVADERGQGVLSGAFATDVDDTLTRVAGTALRQRRRLRRAHRDGRTGAAEAQRPGGPHVRLLAHPGVLARDEAGPARPRRPAVRVGPGHHGDGAGDQRDRPDLRLGRAAAHPEPDADPHP